MKLFFDKMMDDLQREIENRSHEQTKLQDQMATNPKGMGFFDVYREMAANAALIERLYAEYNAYSAMRRAYVAEFHQLKSKKEPAHAG